MLGSISRVGAILPTYDQYPEGYRVRMLEQGFDQAYQSYSAVPIRSSIFELTSSNIRFSAVFLLLRKSSVALRTTLSPVEVVVDRAATSSCSSSWHAVSKCSRFIRIWTICPRYCELRRSTRDRHTFSDSNVSRDYNSNVSEPGAEQPLNSGVSLMGKTVTRMEWPLSLHLLTVLRV